MSSSTTCKVWMLGFFCGVCITYFFVVLLSPFRTDTPRLVYLSSRSVILQNSSSFDSENVKSVGSDIIHEKIEILRNDKERIMSLYSAWSSSLSKQIQKLNVPRAPHLENCRLNVERNKRFDNRAQDGTLPSWSLWEGILGLESMQNISLAPNPPWIVGSDGDNYPLTRRAQSDIWIHQHPLNCTDPNLKFLIADWEREPGFGIGAQLAGMSGLLAIALKEKRILVTNYYNRADHSGCEGTSRSHWSCYFFPETSPECRIRAIELMKSQDAWTNGVVKSKDNYTSKEIWAGRVPRIWGSPWSCLQPTTEVDGNLLKNHRKMDRRWWRAQAIRYLMRYRAEYMCRLLNEARHTAFGLQAAKLVADFTVKSNGSESEMGELVWSNHKPWMPRPVLSMHVRMGDKACEMKMVGFEKYMELADRVRVHFPNLNNIWLSTEMQEVIDKTRLYPQWNFYYTNVMRQTGNMTMAVYEASLGRQLSTNYPLVNFLLAAESDFFIGALGSTWCYLIDGMRNTGGKVLAGYLSVNKDRFW